MLSLFIIPSPSVLGHHLKQALGLGEPLTQCGCSYTTLSVSTKIVDYLLKTGLGTHFVILRTLNNVFTVLFCEAALVSLCSGARTCILSKPLPWSQRYALFPLILVQSVHFWLLTITL